MSDEELLKAFKRWADKSGRSQTLSSLTAREISPRTADIIASGDYVQRPRRKLRAAMLDILKKDKAS